MIFVAVTGIFARSILSKW